MSCLILELINIFEMTTLLLLCVYRIILSLILQVYFTYLKCVFFLFFGPTFVKVVPKITE